jgi:bifunctional DNase/RNase
MDLVGVRVEIPANTPMVLLQEREGEHRLLPIMIGGAEASAIHYALEGVEPPRPLTHDLFVNVLQTLGTVLDRVVVTEVRDHTFFAELHLTTPAGPQVISSRPSDAIALAVRFGASLFAEEDLLDEVGQVPAPEPEDEAEEIIDEFKDFIEHVSPEDFAG